MPLRSLRHKSSTRDIKQPQVPTHNRLPQHQNRSLEESRLPTTAVEPSGLLRPESAASRRRPQSSGTNAAENGSSLTQHPSSPVAPQLFEPPPRLNTVRYASDPQIATNYKNHAHRASSPISDAAPAPTIGFSPSLREPEPDSMQRRRLKPFSHQLSFRAKSDQPVKPQDKPVLKVISNPQSSSRLGQISNTSQSDRPSSSSLKNRNSGEALHNSVKHWQEYTVSRKSESSAPSRTSGNAHTQSIGKVGPKHGGAAAFFKFSRKRQPDHLFPLPVKVNTSQHMQQDYSAQTDASTPVSASTHESVTFQDPFPGPGPKISTQRPPSIDVQGTPSFTYDTPPPPVLEDSALAGSSGGRNGSGGSTQSTTSTPMAHHALRPSMRSRSSTVNSHPKRLEPDRVPTPHVQESGRSSTASTTLGRNSIAGLRSLTSKLRHPSESHSPRFGSPGSGVAGTSANNSFALSRETLVVPEREEGETAGKYYTRLEGGIPKKSIALVLSKSPDNFSHDVLRSLMRTFKFYEEPMDMSMRKILWEIDLPGEAQQIDRVISAFAERYHECNPHIFNTLDEAYLIAYSLIILHSDLFNKNNKHKMQRAQYQKNTRGQGIPEEILGYFYDNIQYTEFIAQNADEEDGERKSKSASKKARKVKARLAANEAAKHGRLDPYDIIIDDKLKLDILRPSLREVLSLENTYVYLGTSKQLNVVMLRNSFSQYGTLQVVSARSRPEAFTSPSTITNPNEAHPGVVDIKVAKVGILWRKEAKRKKTRSPWQEWGAVLTQSQLFFFRNANWVKGLSHQVESNQKHSSRDRPVVFKPPLEEFRYDNKVPTTDAVALLDSGYKRHKHAFVLARRGSAVEENPHENYFEEVLLADNEVEMNDWIAKLNYAAAFRTANVRMQSWNAPRGRRNSNAPPQPAADGLVANLHNIPTSVAEKTSVLQAANARANATTQKLTLAEGDIVSESNKLEDQLRIARHLQILAPFPTRTRNELLTFGARLAHNIKWSRYDISRLKCQRDILIRDLKIDESRRRGSGSNSESYEAVPLSPKATNLTSSRPGGVLNTSTDLYNSSSSAKISSTNRASSMTNSTREADILEGIDEAFATPPETLSRFASPSIEGAFKPLPISYDPADIQSFARQNSSSSIGSKQQSIDPRIQNDSPTPTPSIRGSERDRPSTATESDKEQPIPIASSDSRPKYRPSLQRTLREPRDSITSQHSRSRKGKDAASSVSGDDTNSLQDSESLARKPGRFTVHGKKASIITIGTDLQQISAEERLRSRKQAGGDDTRRIARSESRHGSGELDVDDKHSSHTAQTLAQHPNDSTSEANEMKEILELHGAPSAENPHVDPMSANA